LFCGGAFLSPLARKKSPLPPDFSRRGNIFLKRPENEKRKKSAGNKKTEKTKAFFNFEKHLYTVFSHEKTRYF
jgi:hypothetical protein